MMLRVDFLYVVWLTLLICCNPIKHIIACGDSGQSGILAERDWAEEPLSNEPNVRLLKRRSIGHQGQRKACGDENTENIPLIRYAITLIRSINEIQQYETRLLHSKVFFWCSIIHSNQEIIRHALVKRIHSFQIRVCNLVSLVAI